MNPEVWAHEGCVCGENPVWDTAHQRLFWCDIPNGRIFVQGGESGAARAIYRGEPCGAFALQRDGSLLLLRAGDAARLDVSSGEITVLATDLMPYAGRFNDCLADSQGRLLVGTMEGDGLSGERGGLFRLDPNGAISPLCAGTACSNGLAWSGDGRRLFWADTTNRQIVVFDFEAENGTLSGRRVLLETGDLWPDGLTIDRDEHLWVAFWNGGCVRRFSPDGRAVGEIGLPVEKVTSCVFGGADFDDLFITTAGGNGAAHPDSLDGAVFRAKVEIGGRAPFESRVLLAGEALQ